MTYRSLADVEHGLSRTSLHHPQDGLEIILFDHGFAGLVAESVLCKTPFHFAGMKGPFNTSLSIQDLLHAIHELTERTNTGANDNVDFAEMVDENSHGVLVMIFEP